MGVPGCVLPPSSAPLSHPEPLGLTPGARASASPGLQPVLQSALLACLTATGLPYVFQVPRAGSGPSPWPEPPGSHPGSGQLPARLSAPGGQDRVWHTHRHPGAPPGSQLMLSSFSFIIQCTEHRARPGEWDIGSSPPGGCPGWSSWTGTV